MISCALYGILGGWGLYWAFTQPHWHGREWAAFFLSLLSIALSFVCAWGAEILHEERKKAELDRLDGN